MRDVIAILPAQRRQVATRHRVIVHPIPVQQPQPTVPLPAQEAIDRLPVAYFLPQLAVGLEAPVEDHLPAAVGELPRAALPLGEVVELRPVAAGGPGTRGHRGTAACR
jgi:hypothetical protein